MRHKATVFKSNDKHSRRVNPVLTFHGSDQLINVRDVIVRFPRILHYRSSQRTGVCAAGFGSSPCSTSVARVQNPIRSRTCRTPKVLPVAFRDSQDELTRVDVFFQINQLVNGVAIHASAVQQDDETHSFAGRFRSIRNGNVR